jgi:hypothetical protein
MIVWPVIATYYIIANLNNYFPQWLQMFICHVFDCRTLLHLLAIFHLQSSRESILALRRRFKRYSSDGSTGRLQDP